MPHASNPPAEDPRLPEDDELELLLRDAERLVNGLEAIADVVVTLDMQREARHDQ